jgi:hypothetical protein
MATEWASVTATETAAGLLRGLDTRLQHSAAVAAQAGRVAHLVEADWRASLSDAAWLHDVGYSPHLVQTGFHPLDGARWLRDHGWDAKTCRLVANHTGALEEARRHGLAADLTMEFDPSPRLAAAALVWADLTSSPSGERWDPEQRIVDILERYPPGSIVHEAIRSSRPALLAAVRDIECRLASP